MVTYQFSKTNMLKFVDDAARQGLVKVNTAAGWKAACLSILEDVPDQEDVRKIDAATAVQRYHNKNPGKLSPGTLTEYQRRLGVVIAEFTRYTENPMGYKPYGKPPSKAGDEPSGAPRKKEGSKKPAAAETKVYVPPGGLNLAPMPQRIPGLSLDFPMREDFMAQVVVPRDMSSIEARRLASFILTLAKDFAPPRETPLF